MDTTEDDDQIQFFSAPPRRKQANKRKASAAPTDAPAHAVDIEHVNEPPLVSEDHPAAVDDEDEQAAARAASGADASTSEQERLVTFQSLGLSEWLCSIVNTLGMARPTAVSVHPCVPGNP